MLAAKHTRTPLRRHAFFFFPHRGSQGCNRKNALRASGRRLNRRAHPHAATGRRSHYDEARGALIKGPAMPTQPIPAPGGRGALRSHSTSAQRRAPPVRLKCIRRGGGAKLTKDAVPQQGGSPRPPSEIFSELQAAARWAKIEGGGGGREARIEERKNA